MSDHNEPTGQDSSQGGEKSKVSVLDQESQAEQENTSPRATQPSPCVTPTTLTTAKREANTIISHYEGFLHTKDKLSQDEAIYILEKMEHSQKTLVLSMKAAQEAKNNKGTPETKRRTQRDCQTRVELMELYIHEILSLLPRRPGPPEIPAFQNLTGANATPTGGAAPPPENRTGENNEEREMDNTLTGESTDASEENNTQTTPTQNNNTPETNNTIPGANGTTITQETEEEKKMRLHITKLEQTVNELNHRMRSLPPQPNHLQYQPQLYTVGQPPRQHHSQLQQVQQQPYSQLQPINYYQPMQWGQLNMAPAGPPENYNQMYGPNGTQGQTHQAVPQGTLNRNPTNQGQQGIHTQATNYQENSTAHALRGMGAMATSSSPSYLPTEQTTANSRYRATQLSNLPLASPDAHPFQRQEMNTG
jgi:hypothetical protein